MTKKEERHDKPLTEAQRDASVLAAPATPAGPVTEVIVEGRPVASAPAPDTRPRAVGEPDARLTGTITNPPITEAQLAAGPHRPEPARQVSHDPGYTPTVEATPGPPAKQTLVRATKDGFVGKGAMGVRRRAGDVFAVDDADFSRSWMELVPTGTPERKKTAQDVINERHDALLAGGRPASDTSVLVDDDR